MLVVATAGLLGGLAIATATPYRSASAQSGQSLVFAEHACLEYGVTPHTAAFESCVSRAARAFDRGQPDVAYMQARWTRDAHDACLSDGVSPETLEGRITMVRRHPDRSAHEQKDADPLRATCPLRRAST